MKKILKFIMSFVMFFSIFTGLSVYEAEAEEYSFGCDAYELAWVNDSGGFDTVACYGSFEEAKAAMTQDDYVVRHASSKSPTKIIAIKSGIAISYPRRNGSTTLDVFQHVNYATESGKYKSTYVIQHREMFQPETISYNGNGEGNVKVVLQGFEGYAKLSGMDLVPMKFIEKGLVITLGGQTNDNGVPEEPFEMIPKMSFYSVVQNGNYKDLVVTTYSGYNSASSSFTIGPAADWMSVGQVYYSKDGYNFYADKKMEHYLATYYSYYVFLPLRSQSNISGSVFDAYLAEKKGITEKPTSTSVNDLKKNQSQMAGEGQMFVDSQNVYGVNALLTYAMACNESSYGQSNYAVSKNNLFGWAAVDSNPDNALQFSSIASGIQEQMAYNLRGYMDIFDVRFFGMHLGSKESGFNVKYASDPYWGYKIAAIAYDIDKFSKNYDGTYTDCNVYSLGVINEFKTPYYRTASASSEVMFTSEYSSQYQKNHIVIVKGETNGFYQVQSPNAILADGTILKHKDDNKVQQPAAAYDFVKSVGFISADKITMLNQFNNATIPGYEPSGEFVFELDEFILDESGVLKLSGIAYRPGIYITENNQLIHTLKVYDEFFESSAEVRMNTELQADSKDTALFSGILDLNGLDDGKYYFRLNSDYSSFEEYCDSRTLLAEAENIETKTTIYTFYSDGEMLWVEIKTKASLNPDDFVLISSLKSISMDENNQLSLYGISLIRDLSHTKDSVSHELIAIDMETDEEINLGSIHASKGEYHLSEVYQDGLDYEYGWYDGTVDISSLTQGNYTLYVKTTVNGVSKSSKIYGTSKMKESSMIQGSDGLYRQLVMRYAVSYRVEISVMPYVLDMEVKNKLPRIREGYQNLIFMEIDKENSILKAGGSSFIWNADFSSESEVQYTLYAMNKSDGSVYSASCFGSNQFMGDISPWDNTERIGSDFNYDFSWYEIELPLTEMTDGIYDFVLKCETKDYVEYIDVKKSSSSGLAQWIVSDVQQVKVDVDRKNKNRVEMTLEGFKE